MDKEERIRQRAYELWYGQGCPNGRHQEHWEQACREVEAGYAAREAQRAANNAAATEETDAATRSEAPVDNNDQRQAA